MQLSGKKLTTAILAGLMGATMFGSSVFADDAQRLTNVEVLATQNKTNIDILKNDVQALKGASTKDTYSKDEVDSKLADKANQSDVTTNTNGIATNKQAISDEATARQNADADLQKGVDANKQAISDEATARQNADADLQKGVDANKQAISDEATARQNADADLQKGVDANKQAISDEATARQNADADLQKGVDANKQAISDEATARQNADADLQKGVDANKQAISDEATARQNADADLQKGVDANKQAIADETTARQTDVANLQTNIKDALTNQGVVNDTLTKAVQANSNAIVTSSQNLEKHLGETDGRVDKANAEIHTNAGNIAQNKQDIATNTANIQKNSEAVAKVQEDYTTVKDTVQFIKDNKDAIDHVNTMKTQLDATTAVADNNHTAIQDEIKQRQTDVSNLQTNIKDALNNQGVVNDTLTKAVQANSNAIVTSSQNLEKHLGETDGRVDKANAEIHTNAGNIAQNKADIAQNKTDIAANKKAISDAVAEQGKINNAQNEINGKLTTAVQNNSQAIVANAEAAKNLEKHLGETDGRVDKANAEIHTNAGNIAQNKADIAQNKTDIAANKKAISDAVAEQGKINNAQNEINGKLTTAVQNNSQAIGTTKNGNYVKSSNSVGANLNALDAQVGQNSSNINQLFSDYSSMKTDINKVGARSAALAGLHAVDYDPSNKLSFAVASGSFRSENSVALGAFYRPNENIMFSAASTMGDSDNAYTFGLSFKIGPSSAKTKTTSPDAEELYKVVGQLQDQLAAQQKEIEQLKANKAK